MERTKKKIQWSTEEIELLTELHPQFSSKKWKMISQLFKEHGFSRSEIECREKWINFLDPNLNKKEWEEWELEKLYEIHDQVGTRWCVVQKYIGRTQNKIKNRFYGTLRNYIRFVINFMDQANTCYNYEISKLSPKFLNDMYKAENQFRFLNEEIKQTIYAMRFKIDKKMLGIRLKEVQPLYEKLKSLVFKAFAEIPPPDIKRNYKEQLSKIEVCSEEESEEQKVEERVEERVQIVQPIASFPEAYYPFLQMMPFQQNLFCWYT